MLLPQLASGDAEDFSKWTFTYTDQYQLIKEGANELTAKISCFGVNPPTGTPLSEWHTVNVTGVPNMAGQSLVPPTSFSSPLSPEEDIRLKIVKARIMTTEMKTTEMIV